MIAWVQMADGGADALNNARPLMAEDRWQRRGQMLMLDVSVSGADAGRDHPDQNFIGARLVDDDITEGEGGVLFLNDGRDG
ncbi:hypothetical protein GCM10011335_48660 [Aureimonas glaciei]|uniref:Uncharacterized protein n=1 Tax=Aureimonas glaciei TaxID=1776957 RepID=A0A916YDD6_9HYPH|nr:hypothetical protein GCM10011335_48660 [Aureimonas glaciei]